MPVAHERAMPSGVRLCAHVQLAETESTGSAVIVTETRGSVLTSANYVAILCLFDSFFLIFP